MGSTTGPTSTTSSTTTTSRSDNPNHKVKKEVSGSSNVVSMMGNQEDPFAGMMTEDAFEKLAANGCSFCSADISWGETGVTIIERIDAVLCPSCSRGDAQANRVLVANINNYM